MKRLKRFNESFNIIKGLESNPDIQEVKDVLQDLIDEDFTRITIDLHPFTKAIIVVITEIAEDKKGIDLINYTISVNKLLSEIIYRLESIFSRVNYTREESTFSTNLVHRLSITP